MTLIHCEDTVVTSQGLAITIPVACGPISQAKPFLSSAANNKITHMFTNGVNIKESVACANQKIKEKLAKASDELF